MTSRTEEEVLSHLRRRLGGSPLHPIVVEYCRDREWITDVVAEVASGTDLDDAMEALEDQYRSALNLVRSAGDRPPAATEDDEVVEVAFTHDRKGAALTEIFSIEAGQDPVVVAFRHELLHGNLLSPQEVEEWLKARASIRPAGNEDRPTHGDPTGGIQSELLGYLVPGSPLPRRVAIRSDSVLHTLKVISTQLVIRYGWLESEATTFVLTGQPIRVPRARAKTTRRFRWPAASVITLEISPRTAPSEVAALYRRARRSLIGEGKRSRDLQRPFRTELAVHAFRSSGRLTWREAMAAWNRALPDGARAYSDPRAFSATCREAFTAVTGEELEWEPPSGID